MTENLNKETNYDDCCWCASSRQSKFSICWTKRTTIVTRCMVIEKLAHFDREVIPERRMHAKGSGAYGKFTVTHDITQYTKAAIFSEIGKETDMFVRFSTVAGERGAADAERDIRGFSMRFYTEQGNWDLVGNNTPVFFFRDPLQFPDLNHAS